ncbi:MAG: LPS export ABC transporter periplasmic protein LptC [Prevotella sp.]
MRRFLYILVLPLSLFLSCSKTSEHTAPAIHDRDSVSMMVSYGVNTLVSDSGVIKYRIVSECWDVNTVKEPSRWTFLKGIFVEQFDEKFNVQLYVQADTAWYYDKKKLWELRGRVSVRNVEGLIFRSEELFWDGMVHELYSHKPSIVITPERVLSGTYFRSDERMTRYTISNSVGSFVQDTAEKDTTASTPNTPQDSVETIQKRQVALPKAATRR